MERIQPSVKKNLCLTGDIAPLVFPRRVRQVLCESWPSFYITDTSGRRLIIVPTRSLSLVASFIAHTVYKAGATSCSVQLLAQCLYIYLVCINLFSNRVPPCLTPLELLPQLEHTTGHSRRIHFFPLSLSSIPGPHQQQQQETFWVKKEKERQKDRFFDLVRGRKSLGKKTKSFAHHFLWPFYYTSLFAGHPIDSYFSVSV